MEVSINLERRKSRCLTRTEYRRHRSNSFWPHTRPHTLVYRGAVIASRNLLANRAMTNLCRTLISAARQLNRCESGQIVFWRANYVDGRTPFLLHPIGTLSNFVIKCLDY